MEASFSLWHSRPSQVRLCDTLTPTAVLPTEVLYTDVQFDQNVVQ
jgi:hypothetical protein